MITYKPSDPTTEIIWNLAQVAYEHRRLVSPSASFILGEWVGLGSNFTAVKLTDSTSHALPRMVWTETGRHDVTESEGVTVAVGYFHISTMNYKTGQSFAVGSRLIAGLDGGVGKLLKLPAGAGTYIVVGVVRKVPAVDGTNRLFAEIFPTPVTTVVT